MIFKKEKIKIIIRFIGNPHLLLCIGISWLITNGWAYIMFGIGTLFKISWMIAVSSGYLTIVWIPIVPEKIITITLAIAFLRFFFPKDKKTLGMLKKLHSKFKIKKHSKSKNNVANKNFDCND